MARMTADDFLNLLKLWEIPHHENAGWKTHNHNGNQPPRELEFLLDHHTGDDAPDDADLRVLWGGRSDLPGPLCTGGIRDNGVLELVCWGTAYHAGSGAQNVLNAVRAGYRGNPPAPGPDSVNGNPISLGWEVMYSGGHPMTVEQSKTLDRLNAAICWRLRWPATRVIGHKEWTSRKPDPAHFDMAAHRRRVQLLINAGPPAHTPPTPKDWFTMATEQDVRAAVVAAFTDPLVDIIPDTEYRKDLLAHQNIAGTLLAAARDASDANGAAGKAAEIAQRALLAASTANELATELAAKLDQVLALLQPSK
jgi:hypothetical protein